MWYSCKAFFDSTGLSVKGLAFVGSPSKANIPEPSMSSYLYRWAGSGLYVKLISVLLVELHFNSNILLPAVNSRQLCSTGTKHHFIPCVKRETGWLHPYYGSRFLLQFTLPIQAAMISFRKLLKTYLFGLAFTL